MIYESDRDMLVCSGYRLRGSANAALVLLIFLEIVACFLGVELGFILVTIFIIVFDIYCLFDPYSTALVIQMVLCLLRAAAASVYLCFLLIVIINNSTNNIPPIGYIQSGYTYSVLIAASVIWAIFIIINLIFSVTFLRYSKQLRLEEVHQATRNFQYAQQQMRIVRGEA